MSSEQTLETTRRSFLSAAAKLIAATAGVGQATTGGEVAGDADPVLSLWLDWGAAHRLFSDTCRRQKTLETEMLRELGSFPRVQIDFPDDDSFVWAYTTDDINRVLQNSARPDIRHAALTKLATRQAEWNALDVRIGYSEAKKAEAEAADLEDEFSAALWSTAPRSFAGVAAKLHCVLETEDPGSGLQEAPWPQLRAILADLVRIAEPVSD
ncbi:hypothetical protein QTL95_04015 [Rhizobium sp. S152]|uniref:hypothetical protein n=1 Tax=Rhizobium sp. S152 TaxID=3055038 RepID=UPI0025A983B6|nr:hypothetical protein [Rhizobium sp. S152]MDM9625051.1 hypothetical protein [Rhizobium sp. S152]